MSRRPPISTTEAAFGLACWSGRPRVMARAHRHHELELNYLSSGSLTYRFGGSQTRISAGQLALFWAAVPHQLIALEEPAELCWITLPLALFLRWHLPATLVGRVLNGQPIIVAGAPETELSRMRQWQADLAADHAERRAIVGLELEARLRRLALEQLAEPGAAGSRGDHSHAEQIARLIAERYAEPLRIAEIAAAVGLHPHYAMARFRAALGVSIGTYLTQYRVMHAQRLLATTDASVVAVGLEVGFGSASQFHAAFKQACGCSPGAYRALV